MSNTLAADKSNLLLLEKKDRELDGKLQMMSIVEQEIVNCIELLTDTQSEFQKFDKAKQAVAKQKEVVDRRQLEIKDLSVKEQVFSFDFFRNLHFH